MKDLNDLKQFLNRGTILVAIGTLMILLAMVFATLIPRFAHKDWDRYLKSKGRMRYAPDYPTAFRQMSAQRRMLQNFYFGAAGLICLAAGLRYLSRGRRRDSAQEPQAPTSPKAPEQPSTSATTQPQSAQVSSTGRPIPRDLAPPSASTQPAAPQQRSVPAAVPAPAPAPARQAAPAPAESPASETARLTGAPISGKPPESPASPQPTPEPAPAPAKAPAPAEPKPPAPKRGWKKLPDTPPKKEKPPEPAPPAPAPASAEPAASRPRDEMDF